MKWNVIDLTGQTIGRVFVLERVENGRDRKARFRCRCVCGNEKVISGAALRNRSTLSCGCLKKEILAKQQAPKHGMFGSREYSSWAAMIQRCTNPKNIAYERYGGRGISVCERWRSFENFFIDMGSRPLNHSLERIDNDQGYQTGNCKWASKMEQNKNRRPHRPGRKAKRRRRKIIAIQQKFPFFKELAKLSSK